MSRFLFLLIKVIIIGQSNNYLLIEEIIVDGRRWRVLLFTRIKGVSFFLSNSGRSCGELPWPRPQTATPLRRPSRTSTATCSRRSSGGWMGRPSPPPDAPPLNSGSSPTSPSCGRSSADQPGRRSATAASCRYSPLPRGPSSPTPTPSPEAAPPTGKGRR